MNYLENEKIKALFERDSFEAKKSFTLGSTKPGAESIVENGELVSYVKVNGQIVEEDVRNKLGDDKVVARNPEPLGELNGKVVYNEWLVEKDVWMKNYGVEPTDTFEPYERIESIKALVITDEILEILGSTDGETAKISVSWNPSGMTVFKGGVLTDGGYGIAPDEFNSTYKKVEQKKT